MALTFYPNSDDMQDTDPGARIETLKEAAEAYKAIVLDPKKNQPAAGDQVRATVPRDMVAAFNWDEIAKTLRQVRDLSEANKTSKLKKADLLMKLAEVYEILRGAKMSKLEAVRLALMSESNQLRDQGQVA